MSGLNSTDPTMIDEAYMMEHVMRLDADAPVTTQLPDGETLQ